MGICYGLVLAMVLDHELEPQLEDIRGYRKPYYCQMSSGLSTSRVILFAREIYLNILVTILRVSLSHS